MNHFANNGKEYLKKDTKVRQYRSNQGRSPEQQKNNEICAAISVFGFLIMMVLLLIFGR